MSEVLPEGGRSSRRREEARQVEFVRVGQALKLDTIVKGDAPTSLANTGLFRRSVRLDSPLPRPLCVCVHHPRCPTENLMMTHLHYPLWLRDEIESLSRLIIVISSSSSSILYVLLLLAMGAAVLLSGLSLRDHLRRFVVGPSADFGHRVGRLRRRGGRHLPHDIR